MATVIQCDRCNKIASAPLYELEVSLNTKLVVTNVRSIDLCRECYKELNAFLEHKEYAQ